MNIEPEPTTLALMSSIDVLTYCGDITYRELDYWIRSKAIAPEIEAQGSGRPRWFTPEQAEWLRRIVAVRSELEERGILVTVQAITAMWDACVEGRSWRLDLTL